MEEVFNSEPMEKSMRSTELAAALPEAMLSALLKQSENYHTIPEEIGRLAQAVDVGMVVLAHVMPGHLGDPEQAYTYGVSEHLEGKVLVARDLGWY